MELLEITRALAQHMARWMCQNAITLSSVLKFIGLCVRVFDNNRLITWFSFLSQNVNGTVTVQNLHTHTLCKFNKSPQFECASF